MREAVLAVLRNVDIAVLAQHAPALVGVLDHSIDKHQEEMYQAALDTLLRLDHEQLVAHAMEPLQKLTYPNTRQREHLSKAKVSLGLEKEKADTKRRGKRKNKSGAKRK
jgi:hypothetical protein